MADIIAAASHFNILDAASNAAVDVLSNQVSVLSTQVSTISINASAGPRSETRSMFAAMSDAANCALRAIRSPVVQLDIVHIHDGRLHRNPNLGDGLRCD